MKEIEEVIETLKKKINEELKDAEIEAFIEKLEKIKEKCTICREEITS
jgi:hypothetical protein